MRCSVKHTFLSEIVVPSTSVLVSHPLVTKDLSSILHGVNVYWSPSGVYLREFLKKRQLTSAAASVIISCANRKPPKGYRLYQWLKAQCGVTDPISCISSVLENEALHDPIITLDQADDLLTSPAAASFLTGLAEESVNIKAFKCIVALNNPHLAYKILRLNFQEKFYLLPSDPLKYKWDEGQIRQFLAYHSYSLPRKQRDALVALGLVAGTPEFLLRSTRFNNSDGILHPLAEEYASRWEEGSNILRSFV